MHSVLAEKSHTVRQKGSGSRTSSYSNKMVSDRMGVLERATHNFDQEQSFKEYALVKLKSLEPYIVSLVKEFNNRFA